MGKEKNRKGKPNGKAINHDYNRGDDERLLHRQSRVPRGGHEDIPVLRSKCHMRGGHGERRSRYQPANGSATNRQTVALPIEERSRYLSPKGHATDRQKVALPFFRRTTRWLSHAETRRTRRKTCGDCRSLFLSTQRRLATGAVPPLSSTESALESNEGQTIAGAAIDTLDCADQH